MFTAGVHGGYNGISGPDYALPTGSGGRSCVASGAIVGGSPGPISIRIKLSGVGQVKFERYQSIFKGYFKKTGHLVRIYNAKVPPGDTNVQFEYDAIQTQLDLFFFSSLLNEILECDELVPYLFALKDDIENILLAMLKQDSMTLTYEGQPITDLYRTLHPSHSFNGLTVKATDARSMLKALRNDLVHNIDLGDERRQKPPPCAGYGNVWTTAVRSHLFDILSVIFDIPAGNVFSVSMFNWYN
jgi:hypothetical protein